MKFYRILPYDKVSFGTLRNFRAGFDHRQASVFPPDIMKFFHIFKRVRWVLLEKAGELYTQVPADFVGQRKTTQKEAIRLSFDKEKGPYIPSEKLITKEGKLAKYEGASGFVKVSELLENKGELETFSLGNFVKEEEKVGIALEYSTRSAKEGMLYTRSFYYLSEEWTKSGLVVLAEPFDEVQKGYYKVGGEGKVAKVEDLDYTDVERFLEAPLDIQKGEVYRLYLTTHAYFEGELKIGSELKIGFLRFRLLWLFNRGVEWVSGFAKPFIKMLMPASVLYLEALDSGSTVRLCQIFSKNGVEIDINNLKERGWNSGILWEV